MLKSPLYPSNYSLLNRHDASGYEKLKQSPRSELFKKSLAIRLKKYPAQPIQNLDLRFGAVNEPSKVYRYVDKSVASVESINDLFTPVDKHDAELQLRVPVKDSDGIVHYKVLNFGHATKETSAVYENMFLQVLQQGKYVTDDQKSRIIEQFETVIKEIPINTFLTNTVYALINKLNISTDYATLELGRLIDRSTIEQNKTKLFLYYINKEDYPYNYLVALNNIGKNYWDLQNDDVIPYEIGKRMVDDGIPLNNFTELTHIDYVAPNANFADSGPSSVSGNSRYGPQAPSDSQLSIVPSSVSANTRYRALNKELGLKIYRDLSSPVLVQSPKNELIPVKSGLTVPIVTPPESIKGIWEDYESGQETTKGQKEKKPKKPKKGKKTKKPTAVWEEYVSKEESKAGPSPKIPSFALNPPLVPKSTPRAVSEPIEMSQFKQESRRAGVDRSQLFLGVKFAKEAVSDALKQYKEIIVNSAKTSKRKQDLEELLERKKRNMPSDPVFPLTKATNNQLNDYMEDLQEYADLINLEIRGSKVGKGLTSVKGKGKGKGKPKKAKK